MARRPSYTAKGTDVHQPARAEGRGEPRDLPEQNKPWYLAVDGKGSAGPVGLGVITGPL